MSFRMILSDLEWVYKIFSDTKNRTVSLRQLNFLYNGVIYRLPVTDAGMGISRNVKMPTGILRNALRNCAVLQNHGMQWSGFIYNVSQKNAPTLSSCGFYKHVINFKEFLVNSIKRSKVIWVFNFHYLLLHPLLSYRQRHRGRLYPLLILFAFK